ncbi:hypothetical protein E2C01_064334 [Portunus trituberculatus]|uniref:Uncharacterized protein n=1 Tax=Portunus trituberculatus TaxID=210409 RepID=A0A5B7HJG8_PORTR|nr:hypothetical protein [Portunus trituberculatus]
MLGLGVSVVVSVTGSTLVAELTENAEYTIVDTRATSPRSGRPLLWTPTLRARALAVHYCGHPRYEPALWPSTIVHTRALRVNTQSSRFDRLTRQFDIHISRATHPVNSAASPLGRSVNQRYPVLRMPLKGEIPYSR